METTVRRPVRTLAIWSLALLGPYAIAFALLSLAISWKLSTGWWEPKAYSDRTYYRLETSDHQVFELYCDAAKDELWLLARIQD
jgi:hypothetical protein